RYLEIIEIHRLELEQTQTPSHRVAILLGMATIYEHLIGDIDAAIEHYRAILSIDPSHRHAIASLIRAAERAERWDVVVFGLDREAELESAAERRVELRYRAAEILSREHPDEAISRLMAILKEAPGHRKSIELLGSLFFRLGRWKELIGARKREFELLEESTDRAQVAWEIGVLLEERLGEFEEALFWFGRAFELDPSSRLFARKLEAKLLKKGAQAQLKKLYEKEIDALRHASDHLPSGEQKQRLSWAAMRLGQVLEESGAPFSEVLAAYRAATSHGALRPGAFDACARILRLQGRFDELIVLFEEEAERAQGKRKAALHIEAARIACENAHELERARVLYEKAISSAPALRGAWLGLEELLRQSGNQGLAEVLEAQARLFDAQGARLAALYEIALGDGALSARVEWALQTLLAIRPEDPLGGELLLRAALRHRHLPLRRLYEKTRATCEEDPSIRALHLAWLAFEEIEKDPLSAFTRFEEAARFDSCSVRFARGRLRAAQKAYEMGLLGPEKLADALSTYARFEHDPAKRAALLIEAGLLREKKEAHRALLDFEEALAIAPERIEAAQGLSRIWLSRGETHRAIDVLRKAAHKSKRWECFYEIAKIQLEVLGDLPQAMATISLALTQVGGNENLLLLQAELWEREGQWRAALANWLLLAKESKQPQARLEYHIRAGKLLLERLHAFEEARLSFEAALAIAEDGRALRGLIEALVGLGRFIEALGPAERWVELSRGTSEEAEAWLLLARVAQGKGDCNQMLEAAERALAIGGFESPSHAFFETLLAQSSPEQKRALFEAMAHALRSQADRGHLPPLGYAKLVHILVRELNRSKEALELVHDALRHHPEDGALRQTLIRALLDCGFYEEVLRISERRLVENPLEVQAWAELAMALEGSERKAYAEKVHAFLTSSGLPPPRPLSGEMSLEQLLEIAGVHPSGAYALLLLLTEVLPRLYPTDLEGHGLSAKDRLPPRSAHPLRSLFERAALHFGGLAFECFVHRSRSKGIAVELGEVPVIVVPFWLSELPEATQLAWALRTMALLAMRMGALEKLVLREIERLAAAAIRIVKTDFRVPWIPDESLEEQANGLARHLSRRSRRSLEELIARHPLTFPSDVQTAVERLIRGSWRAALLISDDLEAAFDAMRYSSGLPSELSRIQALGQHPFASELLCYYASEEAMGVRKKLHSP
ncbi:MAG: hypothetical protein NZM37_08295, partial [Sandaracinaceae bacterium]|nr:hypothetical protein [Sandaracinaceae bacterium]